MLHEVCMQYGILIEAFLLLIQFTQHHSNHYHYHLLASITSYHPFPPLFIMSALTQRKKGDKNLSEENKLQILEEQINKAIQSVELTKYRTEELQAQWRDHLLRMSYLVVILAMHQCSKPVSECIQELKLAQPFYEQSISIASSNTSSWSMTGISVILSDCMIELMNVFIAIALFKFLTLRKPHGTFSNTSYCVSSSIIIACLGLFFNDYQRRQKHQEGEGEGGSMTYSMGCVAHLSSWTGDESITQQYLHLDEQVIERTERQFPVSCIFHIIVTGCYFFMKMGMDQCQANVKAMEKVYLELMESKKNGTGKTSTSSGSSKKGSKKTK